LYAGKVDSSSPFGFLRCEAFLSPSARPRYFSTCVSFTKLWLAFLAEPSLKFSNSRLLPFFTLHDAGHGFFEVLDFLWIPSCFFLFVSDFFTGYVLFRPFVMVFFSARIPLFSFSPPRPSVIYLPFPCFFCYLSRCARLSFRLVFYWLFSLYFLPNFPPILCFVGPLFLLFFSRYLEDFQVPLGKHCSSVALLF